MLVHATSYNERRDARSCVWQNWLPENDSTNRAALWQTKGAVIEKGHETSCRIPRFIKRTYRRSGRTRAHFKFTVALVMVNYANTPQRIHNCDTAAACDLRGRRGRRLRRRRYLERSVCSIVLNEGAMTTTCTFAPRKSGTRMEDAK